jgi:hypothetical protein
LITIYSCLFQHYFVYESFCNGREAGHYLYINFVIPFLNNKKVDPCLITRPRDTKNMSVICVCDLIGANGLEKREVNFMYFFKV